MTNAINWAPFGVEMLGEIGPTGEFREALEVSVRDYSGGELWRGSPNDRPEYRIPTRLVATRIGKIVRGCDCLCDWSDQRP